MKSLYTSVAAALTCAALFGCANSPVDESSVAPIQPLSEEVQLRVSEELGILETSLRAPTKAPVVQLSLDRILTDGLYAFYSNVESFMWGQRKTVDTYRIHEKISLDKRHALSWSHGSSTLFRKGKPFAEWGSIIATATPDGRLHVQNDDSQVDLRFTTQVIAYDISGKSVYELIRDDNNQLDELAWHAPEHMTFPFGSVAYHTVYWLDDDEIVVPVAKAFTGAKTLEQVLENFTQNTPFCMSFINHPDVKSYGIAFHPTKPAFGFKKPTSGTFDIIPTNSESIFCERTKGATAVATGTWQIRKVHETRVLELTLPQEIPSESYGIQPLNREAIKIGFAEIVKEEGGFLKKTHYNVVPVRIVLGQKKTVDFRLKFNKTAADAMREALKAAVDHAKTHPLP